MPRTRQQTAVLLSFVLVSFAANSLVTRYVVGNRLLDAYLLTVVRFVAGAVALLVLTLGRGDRPSLTRANLWPAFWLGVYAVCISFGYEHIGAAAGTFVFYATVLAGLVAYDVVSRTPVPRVRVVGALVSLTGVGVLTAPAAGDVTPLGVLLLAVTGAAWALYTAAGRTVTDPQTATTGNFTVLAVALMVPVGVTVSGGPTVTTTGLVLAALMGSVTTALSYVAWYACQRRMSATTAGTVQTIIPILTAAAATVLLGERLTVVLVLAALLVFAGLWIGRPR
ncbi:MAG TPA: DMT family transporter [Lapillicoccus sp.]|nr:DMT family transporter [Lapillicoccus sp.]